MKLLSKIASARANVLGTALIAAGSSMLTVFAMNQFHQADKIVAPQAALPLPSATSVLECGENVYSPVQRQCVSKQVFDGEMKRLFAALGIDASIYGADTETK